MAKNVILDAMLQRADFETKRPEAGAVDHVQNLSIESLGSNGLLATLLRKPDFQRETNHWDPEQVVSFLESFLDSELIPSVILWRSPSFVFVIDGGHRVSTLRAWIEDDYGDGTVSFKYYSNNFTNEQKKNAQKTRELVENRIGKYTLLREALREPSRFTSQQAARARNMATRSLNLQWVAGDADKAESSFFKINTQGTPLDDTEELLLKNRHRSVAIAARSVVRAATGHSYWSKFEDISKAQIELLSKELHNLLFSPEIDRPIKTIDLPLGGSKSPVDALELLMTLISITNAEQNTTQKPIEKFEIDSDGSKTATVLRDCIKIVRRVVGNQASSLGLHPAIYYYSNHGRQIPDLLLGMLLLVRRMVQSNNPKFFSDFARGRVLLEEVLIENKGLITQALQLVRSTTRIERVAELFANLVEKSANQQHTTEEEIVRIISPNSVSKILAVSETTSSTRRFSDDTKSAIFIQSALKSAQKCPVCGGYLDTAKSVSFDHVVPLREGGQSAAANGQLTHPYCNTGVKS